MIQQTKNAIAKLKKSRLNRSEYTVRTPKDKHGEWGRAKIELNLNRPPTMELAKELAEVGLWVSLHILPNHRFMRVYDFQPYYFVGGYEGIERLRVMDNRITGESK